MSTVDLSDARWRKSSHSGDGNQADCVEVAHVEAKWRKSSRSGHGNDGNCVEVAYTGEAIAIRDSKNPDGGALIVPPGPWVSFAESATRPSWA